MLKYLKKNLLDYKLLNKNIYVGTQLSIIWMVRLKDILYFFYQQQPHKVRHHIGNVDITDLHDIISAASYSIVATEKTWNIHSDDLWSPVLETIFLLSWEMKWLAPDPRASVDRTVSG